VGGGREGEDEVLMVEKRKGGSSFSAAHGKKRVLAMGCFGPERHHPLHPPSNKHVEPIGGMATWMKVKKVKCVIGGGNKEEKHKHTRNWGKIVSRVRLSCISIFIFGG
jgi:hypothetical protein